ncbi:CAAX prenyl protease, partial [Mortierella sp. AD032]
RFLRNIIQFSVSINTPFNNIHNSNGNYNKEHCFVLIVIGQARESARFQASTPIESQKLDRNHPLVIKQRFKGIALTCCVVPIYLWWLFKFSGTISSDESFWERLGRFLGLLGISIPNNIFKLVNHVVLPLFLVGCLFMGPTLMMFLSNELPFQQAFDWATQRQHIQGLMGMRNFVVGPISEEFIFRACMVAIVANSGARSYMMIFVLPLVFGIAHINHAYESYVKKGRTRQALLGAAAMAVFQLLYTTLFGWFATFLFLRTSNLIAPCLCHAFCNMMGFPDVTNIQYFGRWKKWLYLTFVLGMVLFGVLLQPLTNPAWYGDEERSAYWRITMGAPTSQDP